jgi:hypothetical protein
MVSDELMPAMPDACALAEVDNVGQSMNAAANRVLAATAPARLRMLMTTGRSFSG